MFLYWALVGTLIKLTTMLDKALEALGTHLGVMVDGLVKLTKTRTKRPDTLCTFLVDQFEDQGARSYWYHSRHIGQHDAKKSRYRFWPNRIDNLGYDTSSTDPHDTNPFVTG